MIKPAFAIIKKIWFTIIVSATIITVIGVTFVKSLDASVDLTHWLLVMLLVLFSSVILVTWWIVKMTNPLKDIQEKVNSLAHGDYSVRFISGSSNEFNNLAQSFNQVAENIERTERQKREFIAIVSHELRTPLSYIIGYTEAIIDDIVKTEEDRIKYLSLIKNESNRLQTLVNDLLKITKLDNDSNTMKKHPIAFGQFIEDFMAFFYPMAAQKQITLVKELDYEVIIDGDESSLGQLLQNLLSNALKYSNEGSKVTVSLKRQKNKCILEIIDNGIGIAKEDIPLLTKRFYRVDKARKRSEGAGLGLAIVKRIVSNHQAVMEVESELGKGSTFRIIFPLRSDS